MQFTIARLMACTALFALAAFVATVKLPVGLTESHFGEFDLLPIILITFLSAAAIGVLLQGRPGVKSGFQIGCALVLLTFIIVPIFVMFGELARWLVRYF